MKANNAKKRIANITATATAAGLPLFTLSAALTQYPSILQIPLGQSPLLLQTIATGGDTIASPPG